MSIPIALRAHRISHRTLQLTALLFAVFSAVVASATDRLSLQLSATEAFERAQQGQLTIIDIRQPEEWRQTGIAQGAKRVSMLHPEGGQGFVRDVLRYTQGRTDLPIALICRTGNRSTQLQQALLDIGFTQVLNIPEGMVGSAAGPGWLRQGLPTEPCPQC